MKDVTSAEVELTFDNRKLQSVDTDEAAITFYTLYNNNCEVLVFNL
eukprot:CAMPEP_0194429104 /NCGR_PEP_ID=MMETSP0176-20130528/43712_1 /TAXON_ID=216777 /ORGANISM="Proboscia alata, Strain PI-D3" /LENGTH=45 /DNA_ID= /DNA_START= /DNA_END= /DNA_ORIENTATION=